MRIRLFSSGRAGRPLPLPSILSHGQWWILAASLLAASAAAAQQVQDRLQYDARGNIIQRTIGEWPIGYRYDGLDRLREETAPGNQRLVLDADGNRLADGRSVYRVMPGGQRLADRDGIALAHGPAGHLLADRVWLGGRWVQRSFEWTLAGQIKTVRIDGSTVATYHYNDARQRTRKTLVAPPSGVPAITLYRYDPAGHLTLEVAGSAAQASGFAVAPGQVLVRYIWQDDEPIAVVWPARTPGNPDQIMDRTVYLHADHLNTPRRATDARGVVVWQWISDAFGSSLADEDPDQDGQRTAINLRFPGQYFDAESGLHYNWHRYYDPQVGRYTQPDPIGLAGGVNLYAYVNGNPISNFDPLGLETYICRRPLGGAPGSFAPPLLNHTYVCVGGGSNMVCGSTTASRGGVLSNILNGSPGAPTTSDTDYFKPEACERRWGEDTCIETCIANALKSPDRPKYGVGLAGTDCQEYTEDVVRTCEKRCGRR